MIEHIPKQQIVSTIAVVLIFNLVPRAEAEIYKYIDENGQTVYTDKPIGDELRIQPNLGRPGRSVAAPRVSNSGGGNTGDSQSGLNDSGFAPTPPVGADPTRGNSQGDSSGPTGTGGKRGAATAGGAAGGGGGGGQGTGAALNSGSAQPKPASPAAAAAGSTQSAPEPASTGGATGSATKAPPSASPAQPAAADSPAPDPPAPLLLSGTPTLRFRSAADFGAGKLRGFVLGDASQSYQPGDEYFTGLVATGANLGRVWIRLRRCEGCDQYTVDDTQLRNMDYFVSKARAYGFWIVVVVATNDTIAGDLWTSERLQQSLISNWQFIASRYKDVPEVAGYDLLNEPVVTWADKGSSRLVWFKLATDITTAIRSVDPKHVVIVEPTPGGEQYAFVGLEPIQDTNLVYSLHMYRPLEITHQGVSDDNPMTGIPYPSPSDSPIGVWDKAKLSNVLEPVRTFSRKTGIPIYVGEFSCSRESPSGSRDRYVSDLTSLFQAENWAWTYHQWRGWPGWNPENVSTDRAVMAFKRDTNSSTMMILRSYFKLNRQ